jgi:hypothetical protein
VVLHVRALQRHGPPLPHAPGRVDDVVISDVRPAVANVARAHAVEAPRHRALARKPDRVQRVVVHRDHPHVLHRVRAAVWVLGPHQGAARGPSTPRDHPGRDGRAQILRDRGRWGWDIGPRGRHSAGDAVQRRLPIHVRFLVRPHGAHRPGGLLPRAPRKHEPGAGDQATPEEHASIQPTGRHLGFAHALVFVQLELVQSAVVHDSPLQGCADHHYRHAHSGRYKLSAQILSLANGP